MSALKNVVAWVGVLVLALGGAANAAVVTQYSFENNLNDTAAGGGTADTLTATPATGPLSVSYTTGIVGQAVRVSRDPGEATVLSAADSNDLDLAANWTVEAYVNPDSANTGTWDRFITKWFDAAGEYHWTFRYANNGQDLFLNGPPAIDGAATGTVPLNQWTHVAMTGDSTGGATGIKLWQNGVVVGTAAYAAVTPGTNTFRIGNSDAGAGSAGSQFSGLVDELNIHDAAQGISLMQQRAGLLPSYSQNPGNGLLTFYEFEGNGWDTAHRYAATSGTVRDNLTPVGNVSFATGLVGQAAQLSGGYFTAAHSADVVLPATFTIEAWVNPSSLSAWERLVLAWGPGGDTSYHFSLHNGQVSLFITEADNNSFEVAVGGALQLNVWQHIAAVLDASAGVGYVYLNGQQVGTSLPFDGTIRALLGEGLGVGDAAGQPAPGSRYNGLLDELAIWNIALPESLLREHYLAGARGYGLMIPEPTTLSLLALGGLALARRRRRRASAASVAGRRRGE